MLTPVDETTAGAIRVEAVGLQRFRKCLAALEVDRDVPQTFAGRMPDLDEPAPFPLLGSGLVNLEDSHRDVGVPLSEGVKAGAQNDVLLDAGRRVFGHEVVQISGPRHDRGTERLCALGVHVAARPPVRLGIGKPQADRVLEHMWWGVEFDVQGAPQGSADGGAVGC